MKPFLTIQEIKEKLEKKEITPKDVLSFYKKRIKKYNPKLNAFLEVFEEEFDKEHSSKGLLAGIPGLLKDNMSQKGRITSCASKILSNYKAPYDATITKKLKDEGAIIVGRGNMDEFAMGSSGEFSAYGATLNPWDSTRAAGGSSSGPAGAVGAGLVPWAIGSETGSSVRIPAAFCNLVGLYPSYGRFSRKGIVAFASSTDQVGPITKTVYDNALLASIMSGNDEGDGTSINQPRQDFTKDLSAKLPQNLKIGVIKDSLESDGVDPQIKESFTSAINNFEKMGATIKYVSIPNIDLGIAVYFVLSRAEAASNLSRYDGTLYGNRDKEATTIEEMYIKTRQNNFGKEVKRRILMGNYVLSAGHKDAFYNKALLVRSLLQKSFEDTFKDVDLLISPTSSTLAFQIGKESSDPLAMYMADFFTVPMCISGIPGLSIPCGFSKENLPIGFQFVGPRFSEHLIYKAAFAYEQQTQFYLKNPAGFE
ncbi:TPA: Asp-tRNA(Asn)/Glu-tRNA(Gln) amidotransferase GatCAB subunit A [Candidatus Dependentiae bacterium]|nr:MAG: Glutamyl-tRNA(Gln) amidotransferase subunit A [candidate division TM6 bacterium GW2011_GWE2_31_21]KKP52929.1 MAG: Glutamyl-tRNA(Gln) amidotransferase subunit A [candidate division TM6 bacterium GW2011_GWF2_33_332]HBS47830.1 Asp-tRNA(Asn)/Glu-tRNA(Gln) amidotransferase GatCAB subunit A [Candidatus Dependentiae bacterium]HBZ73194.1 Asp-tRNA(Asn)/Glu-tRNA(Gln) amidotransferase GatCAB subunit A [Candidatus Dependentiae bacterium]